MSGRSLRVVPAYIGTPSSIGSFIVHLWCCSIIALSSLPPFVRDVGAATPILLCTGLLSPPTRGRKQARSCVLVAPKLCCWGVASKPCPRRANVCCIRNPLGRALSCYVARVRTVACLPVVSSTCMHASHMSARPKHASHSCVLVSCSKAVSWGELPRASLIDSR